MLNVLIALWLFFGFNEGAEHRLVPHNVGLSHQNEYSASVEVGDEEIGDASKPRIESVSWGKIKALFRNLK